MKVSCLLTRRDDITRQAFREYYESQHAPLGMRHFPFQKYLRNHVLESSSEIDFDVIMESYFDDQVDVAAIDNGDIRSIMLSTSTCCSSVAQTTNWRESVPIEPTASGTTERSIRHTLNASSFSSV